MKITWLDKPQRYDYAAAAAYLNLTMDHSSAKAAAEKMKKAEMTEFTAKTFSGVRSVIAWVSNSHVEKDITRIARDEKLSPLLLYRDKTNGKLIIADGYHRLCAVYKFDEDAMIPCKIV